MAFIDKSLQNYVSEYRLNVRQTIKSGISLLYISSEMSETSVWSRRDSSALGPVKFIDIQVYVVVAQRTLELLVLLMYSRSDYILSHASAAYDVWCLTICNQWRRASGAAEYWRSLPILSIAYFANKIHWTRSHSSPAFPVDFLSP